MTNFTFNETDLLNELGFFFLPTKGKRTGSILLQLNIFYSILFYSGASDI